MPWTRERLRNLLEGTATCLHSWIGSGPQEREGLPALHVESRDGGHVEVVDVKNIEGLASAWKERHLFDLSFKVRCSFSMITYDIIFNIISLISVVQVIFKAFWLSDFALMSMDGSVTMDFTSNLLQEEAHRDCA